MTHPLLVSLGQKPRRGTVKVCKYCGIEFYAGPCHQKRLFCSKRCSISRDKAEAFYFNCVICGIKVFTQPVQMKSRNRQTCSIACRSLLQTRRAQEALIKNPPTKGALNRRIRYSKRMDDWRKAVFERDKYTCQGCGQKGGYLQADHIKPFAFFPESRFDIANGRTLCRPCHKATPTFGRRAIQWAENQHSERG